MLDALKWLHKQFTFNTEIPVEFITNNENVKIEENTAICIFRVIQESLTNITRYAKAHKVVIRFNVVDKIIFVSIEDDGVGFDVASARNNHSFGLLGMTERLRALHGTIDVISFAGKGTTVNIKLPLRS